MKKHYLMNKLTFAALTTALLFALSCGSGSVSIGGKIGLSGAGKSTSTGIAKYDDFLKRCEALEADIKGLKEDFTKAKDDLTAFFKLASDATAEDIRDAIRDTIKSIQVKGEIRFEVKIEGGVFASADASVGSEGAEASAGVSAEISVSIEVAGGVEVTAETNEMIETVKAAILSVARAADKLDHLVDEVPALLDKAAELAESAKDDIKDPLLVANVAARLTGLSDLFKEVEGMSTMSLSFTVTISAGFSAEAGGEAGASADAG
ncbi:MAG: hypothetical protein ABIJ56_04480 [Pseudomonadota bacterium]